MVLLLTKRPMPPIVGDVNIIATQTSLEQEIKDRRDRDLSLKIEEIGKINGSRRINIAKHLHQIERSLIIIRRTKIKHPRTEEAMKMIGQIIIPSEISADLRLSAQKILISDEGAREVNNLSLKTRSHRKAKILNN